jgi:hypothetical protein
MPLLITLDISEVIIGRLLLPHTGTIITALYPPPVTHPELIHGGLEAWDLFRNILLSPRACKIPAKFAWASERPSPNFLHKLIILSIAKEYYFANTLLP